MTPEFNFLGVITCGSCPFKPDGPECTRRLLSDSCPTRETYYADCGTMEDPEEVLP